MKKNYSEIICAVLFGLLMVLVGYVIWHYGEVNATRARYELAHYVHGVWHP